MLRDRILHLADLHLGAAVAPRLEALNPTLHAALRRGRDGLLGRLAGWIAEPASRVGLVLVAGDLFHSHRPEDSLAAAARSALAQIAAHVPVVTVPGNHDEYSYAQCVYRQGSWPGQLVTAAEPAEVWRGELPGGGPLAVWAATYVAGEVPPGSQVVFPPVEGPAVALLHATLSDHFPGLHDRCFQVQHQQVAAAGYRYLAAGHIHAPHAWTCGRCEAVYPGPPVGTSPSDPGAGRLTLVELRPAGVQIQHVDDLDLLGHRWLCRRLRVEPGEKPADVAQRGLPTLPLEERVISVWELEGSVPSEDFALQLQERLLAEGRTVIVEPGTAAWAPPPDLEILLAEQTLAGEFVRAWKQWRSAGPADGEDAVRVLYEGLEALRCGPSASGRG